MNIKEIASLEDLKHMAGSQDRIFLLLFKSGTEKSDCAMQALKELDHTEGKGLTILSADVTKVRDIHPVYGIESVPTLLEFESGRMKRVFKGCNSKEFYNSVITGSQYVMHEGEDKREKNVTVYSTPTCTWCNTLKSYLKEKNIRFRDIDVSVDQKAAEQMVNKSGQQGVPQTDIDGQIIVGFDKKRIDSLLKI